jgi:hypothetical protein
MKTKKQVLAENPELKTIINAVINRVGMASVSDINNHGINNGYPGFIYYIDTHKFALRYRKIIIILLERDAIEFGIGIVEMVKNFGVFKRRKMDAEEQRELFKFLGGGKCEQSTITNVMAWYAAETVCRLFDE